MKLTLLVFLHAFLCLPVLAQQRTDKDLADLRGPVHVVRTTTFHTEKTGKTVKEIIHSEIVETYERQGNLIEKRDAVGTYSSKSLFSRAAQGSRVEKIIDLPLDPAAPPPPIVPGPGERGEAFLTLVTTYQFDPEDKRLEATTHRRSGQLLQVDPYLFDEKGWLVEYARKDRPEDA